jgi:hypothetical protein
MLATRATHNATSVVAITINVSRVRKEVVFI